MKDRAQRRSRRRQSSCIDRQQNLAFGAALASTGLTIPAIALASSLIGMPLALGLGSDDLVLLILTFFVMSITLAPGRIQLVQGAVHLMIFAAFPLPILSA